MLLGTEGKILKNQDYFVLVVFNVAGRIYNPCGDIHVKQALCIHIISYIFSKRCCNKAKLRIPKDCDEEFFQEIKESTT